VPLQPIIRDYMRQWTLSGTRKPRNIIYLMFCIFGLFFFSLKVWKSSLQNYHLASLSHMWKSSYKEFMKIFPSTQCFFIYNILLLKYVLRDPFVINWNKKLWKVEYKRKNNQQIFEYIDIAVKIGTKYLVLSMSLLCHIWYFG
jgi:hypothetical protein